MKKKVIFSCFVGVTFFSMLLPSQIVQTQEIIEHTEPFSSIQSIGSNSDNLDSKAILTRYWTSGWIKTGSPAPAVAFFQSGAYRGWLSRYRELPSHYGTTGYYEGYFYHNSVPFPVPLKLNILNNDLLSPIDEEDLK